jgi:hypothetical protein
VTPVSAEIGTGRFTLLPEITVEEAYRSNVFLTESDHKCDFVTTVTPGLGVRYGIGDNSVSLNYRVGFLDFARYSRNNYQNHRANTLLRFSTAGGLHFGLKDDFTKSTLERSGTIERQRDFHENVLNGTVGYTFSDRWKLDAKYVRDDLSFRSSLDRNSGYKSELIGTSLYYRLLPRVSGMIEYDYLIKGFAGPDTADHKDHLFYGGVAFDPKGKLKGNLRAGYGQKHFDKELTGRNDDPTTWILSIDLVKDFDSRTSMALDAVRELADDTDYDNASYVNTRAALSFHHFFTGKIGVSGAVGYRRAAYLDRLTEPVTNAQKKRRDAEWSFRAAGIYNIQKWLTARMEYRYSDRNSNFKLYSYTDHRVLFSVVVAP